MFTKRDKADRDDAIRVSLLRRRRLAPRYDFDSDYQIEMEPYVRH